MSRTLDLPDLTGSEKMGVSSGWEDSASILRENETREFVNTSLNNIQTFFSRMVQLDPEEDELLGDTGRDINGFRLTTEDEPDGVDHDTAISIRSDHVANLSIQSGKASTSDALLNMGTWDSNANAWGIQGALKIDMSNNNAFEIHSNYGKISFDNVDGAGNRRLTADIFNFKIQSGTQPYAEFQNMDSSNPALFFYDGSDPSAPSNGAVVYAKSGDLYRRKSDGTVSAWATGGGSGTIDEAADYSMTGTWSFSPSSGKSVPSFQPYASGAPFTIGSNGFDQVVSRLNADLLDGNHASVFPQDSAGVGTTIVGNWTFNPTSGDDFPLMPKNTKFNQTTGTAPFQVDSTTVVANLHAANSDQLGGTAAASYATDAEVATLLTGYANLSENEAVTGDYTFTGDVTVGGGGADGSFTIAEPDGAEAPIILTTPSGTVVTGLNADLVDGIHGTALANTAQTEEITGTWTFSTPPAFTQSTGSSPFTVSSITAVANLRSATSELSTNSLELGGVTAASYPRNDNNETITSIWQFGNASNAVPISMAEMATPTEPATSFGYLYHNSADNGIYWMTHNTEGDYDTNLLAGDSSALFADAATTSQTTYQEFRTIAPTTPDQTYAIEVSLVGRGTAGSFDNGFVYVRAYAMFYTNDSAAFVRLPDQTYFRTPYTAKDGSGSTKTVTSNNTGDFDLQIIDSSDNIVVKARGYNSTSGTPNAFSWKCWTKVYQV